MLLLSVFLGSIGVGTGLPLTVLVLLPVTWNRPFLMQIAKSLLSVRATQFIRFVGSAMVLFRGITMVV